MKIVTLLMLAAAIMLGTAGASAGAGVAAGGGNSPNAKSCQHGGWQTWLRRDQTAFANQGDCVSYAAQGGELTPPTLGF
jgi:hypothetical protein